MKNIFLSCLVFLFSIPFILSAETEVYIYPIATDSSSYRSGDTLKGQFTIHNVRPERQAGIYYEIGVGLGTEYSKATPLDKVKFEPLYLEANSKRIIPFEYTIPFDVFGQAILIVNAYTPDGRLVGFEDVPILVRKGFATIELERLFPIDGYVTSSGRGRVDFAIETRLYKDEKTGIEVIFAPAKKNHTIQAYVEYKHLATGQIINSETKEFQVGTTEQVTINIPTPQLDLAGSYETTILFKSDSALIAPATVNYYLVGPTLVFTDVKMSKLTLKKNQKFDLSVKHFLPTIYSSEELDEIKSELEGSIIKLNIENENGAIIFTEEKQIMLGESTEILFEGKASDAALSTKVIVQAVSKDGKVFSEHIIKLPSEKEVKAWYGLNTFDTWIWLVVGLILVVLIGYLYKKYKTYISKISTPLTLLAILLVHLSFVSIPMSVDAYAIESGYILGGTWLSEHGFYAPIFYNPLPSSVRGYNPGESFDLLASIRVFGNISLGSDIRVFTQHYQNQKWSTTNIPPSNLFNILDRFDLLHNAYSYCSKPYTILFNWFRCEASQEYGLEDGVTGSVVLLNYFTKTLPGSSTKNLSQNIDWYGAGLFNNSQYLIPSKEFETDIKSLFTSISGGITRKVDHDGPQPTEYSGNLPHGWMFMMHTTGCTWTNGYPSSSCLHRFLHWKYFFPGTPFVSAYLSKESTIKSEYERSLSVINEAKRIIVKYNLPGYENVANFNFNDINTHYASNFNSNEFNVAIDVILDFTYELNSSLHKITKDQDTLIKTQEVLSPGYVWIPQAFDVSRKNVFTAPTTPGLHKIYFYALLDQAPPSWEPTWSNDNRELLVSQTICVRGAGVCPDEEPLTCPNLIGNYTEDANGIIYKDSVATNPSLEKDINGNCVEAPVCDSTHSEGDISNRVEGSICYEGAWSCEYGSNALPEWQLGESIVDCSTIAPPTVSCSADPYVVEPGRNTILTANPQGGILAPGNTYSYRWSDVADFSTQLSCVGGAGSTCQLQVGLTEETKQIFVEIIDDRNNSSGTATNSCSYTIQATTCMSNPDLCQNNIVQTASCIGVNWEYSPTGELCSEDQNGGPEMTVFKFLPNIIALETDTCKLSLVGTNIQSCRMFKNNQVNNAISSSINSQIINSNINTSGSIEIPVGTYTLGCTGTSTSGELIDILVGSQKCTLNPDYREN